MISHIRSDLMYYSGGIYSSAAHQRAEWEPVDHAVLLVGYGSENGRDLVVGMVGGLRKSGKMFGKRWENPQDHWENSENVGRILERLVGGLEHHIFQRGGSTTNQKRIEKNFSSVSFRCCPETGNVLGCRSRPRGVWAVLWHSNPEHLTKIKKCARAGSKISYLAHWKNSDTAISLW